MTKPEQDELDWLLTDLPNFRTFILGAWSVLEPSTQFVDGWHIGAIAEHLQAVSDGQIQKLLVNVPPGSMKSLLVSAMWPAWDWLKYPERRFLTASYAQSLSTRDALKTRRLIQSNWYQSNWSHVFQLTGDQNQKTRYENNKTGFRIATSVGGATGERAGVKILDDPHNIDDVQSDTVRQSTIDWLKMVWSERSADSSSIEIVVMQRLHEEDVTGYLLELGGYEHLMLPMRFEGERRCHTVIGFTDPRQTEGELLCPARFSEVDVRDKEKRLGSYGAAGQLQQRPAPSEGGIFKRQWWRFWQWAQQDLPPIRVRLEDGSLYTCPLVKISGFEEQAQSWDFAFKATKDSSNVCGQVWGTIQARMFLIDQLKDKMEFLESLGAIRELTRRHPRAFAKLVEDKANGPAIINSLQSEIAGIIPIQVFTDKISRARAVAPFCEAGNVYLPHPQNAPWIYGFIENCANFPNAKYKDEIDTMSQILIRLQVPVERQEMQYTPIQIGAGW